jgi:hypothetical protein
MYLNMSDTGTIVAGSSFSSCWKIAMKEFWGAFITSFLKPLNLEEAPPSTLSGTLPSTNTTQTHRYDRHQKRWNDNDA